MRVLLATDGSPDAETAASFLRELPLTPGSQLRVVSVVVPPRLPAAAVGDEAYAALYALEQFTAAEEARVAALLRRAAAREWPGVEISTEVRRGSPAVEIIAAAEEWGADLVVVGSAGLTGLKGFLVGSVARHVSHHAGRPVLVGRAPRYGLARVIVAIDESEHAAHAAALAARLPLPLGCQVTAAHVLRRERLPVGADQMDPDDLDRLESHLRHDREVDAEALLERVLLPFGESGRTVTHSVREGDPAHQLIALAEETGADLIVAGARGVSLVRGLIVGSVADRLLQHAPCSVLLVH